MKKVTVKVRVKVNAPAPEKRRHKSEITIRVYLGETWILERKEKNCNGVEVEPEI